MRVFRDRRFRLPRSWSNRELRRISPLFEGDVANVSGWEDLDKEGNSYRSYFSSAGSYTLTNFAGERGCVGREGEQWLDLSGEPSAALVQRFDVVFNHTTLEHIFDVRRAFANLCRLTRDVLILVVPFAQQQHETDSFGDFWRFTPTCLRALFAENGLSVVYESESPHADAATYLFFVGSRHPERWRGHFPRALPIRAAGSWIGRTRWRSAAAGLGVGIAALVQLMRRGSPRPLGNLQHRTARTSRRARQASPGSNEAGLGA